MLGQRSGAAWGYVLRVDVDFVYVGITSHVSRRMREHANAGRLKGRFFVVEETTPFRNMDEARCWEVREIERRRSTDQLLNVSSGGHGGRGRSWSPEARKRVSDAAKARWQNPEYREKVVAAVTVANRHPHAREAASDRVRALSTTEGNKARRSAGQKRSWQDGEIRQKRIDSIRKASNSPESRTRRSEAAYARWAREKA